MFPFRPRAPAFGGKLKRKRAEALGQIDDNPLSQLAAGGPVERAIREDLQVLRSLFRSNLDRSFPITQLGTNLDRVHCECGRSFLHLKAAFREGKFGALHTRCEPPRSDREAYTQLIYSAALSLLTTSMERLIKMNIDLILSTNDDLIDSSFALFTLYTLYDTCPLPTVPVDMPRNSCAEHDEKALTCLPMGLISTDDSSATFRRVYKTPIRLSRRHFLFFLLLHDVCSHIISKCEMGRINAIEENIPWVCSCSLASDCISVMTRLYKNRCLDFCEYCGPLSVEGFAGSEDYFNHIVDPPRSTIVPSVSVSASGPTHQDMNMNGINIPTLESLHSIYHQNLMNLFRSKELGTSKPLHSLNSTLSPILEKRRLSPLTDQFSKLLNLLERMTNDGDPSTILNENQNQSHQPQRMATTLSLLDNIHAVGVNRLDPTINTATQSSTDNHLFPFNLVFDPDISTSLRHGVESALKTSFMVDIASRSKSIGNEIKSQYWLWDEFSSFEEQEDLDHVEDSLESDDNSEDIVPVKNDDSMNALQRLLSLARYK